MKEGAFNLSICSRVVVVNSWHAKFIVDIDDKLCQMCMFDILETISYCKIAGRAWGFSIVVVVGIDMDERVVEAIGLAI